MDPSQLNDLSLRELFDLSFRSQKHQNLVREFLKTSKIELCAGNTIILTRGFGDGWYRELSLDDKNILRIICESRRILNTLDTSKQITIREIGGLSIDFEEGVSKLVFCYTDHPHLVSMALISYLVKVFNCKLDRLVVPLEDVEDLSVYFEDPFYKTCDSLIVHKGSLSADEMIRFLEGFPNAKSKHIFCNPGRDFVYDKSLSVTNLCIENAHWFTCDNLISADCRNIRLSDSNLTSEDLNRFVKTRLESGRVREENLTIDNQNGFDMSVITSGLSVKPHNVRSSPHWMCVVSWSHFVDVIRDSDGMVITIGKSIEGTIVIDI